MESVWFVLVALMLAVYVLLDGFDLGAGAIHPFVARTATERRMVYAAVGPVWEGLSPVYWQATQNAGNWTVPYTTSSSFDGASQRTGIALRRR